MIPVILVVDDDASILELLRYHLLRAGFRTLTTSSSREARGIMETTSVDLVVLDLLLKDGSGLDLCQRFRRTSRAPVLFLSARYDEADRIRALEAGADDYLMKPFSPREFIARVRAQLRRWMWETGDAGEAERLTVGPLTLDVASRRVVLSGNEIHVTHTEFDILRVLCRAPGRVFPRERLLALATGQDVVGSARTVDVHIRSLRLKLEPNPAQPRLLETVRGAGYCIGRTHINGNKEGSA